MDSMMARHGWVLPAAPRGSETNELQVSQAEAYRFFGQIGDRLYLKFVEKVLTMCFHCRDRAAEYGGRFLRAPAFGDQLQHLPLTRCQLMIHGILHTWG